MPQGTPIPTVTFANTSSSGSTTINRVVMPIIRAFTGLTSPLEPDVLE